MNRVKKFYFALTGVFIGLAIIILILEVLGFLNLSGLQSSITEAQYRLVKSTDQANILQSISINYKKALTYQKNIDAALPDQKEASTLFSDLDAMATGSGLKLTLIQSNNFGKTTTVPKDPSLLQTIRGKYSIEMPLTIQMTGSYNSFVVFIQKLENYQRLTNISSVDIEKSLEKDAPADNINVKLNLTAYLK